MNRNFFRTFLRKFHTFFVHLVLDIFFFHNSQNNFFAPMLIGYFIHFCHVPLFETNYFFQHSANSSFTTYFPAVGRNFPAQDSFPGKRKKRHPKKMSFLAAHCGNAVCPPQPYIILYSFQISRLYSAIVLSDEKKPAFAVLMSIFFAHAMRSS